MMKKTFVQNLFCETIISLYMVLAAALQLSGQSVVAGQITDETRRPVPYANVLLLQVEDSTLVKGEITGEDGSFLLEQVRPGVYYLEVSMIGYSRFRSGSFRLNADEPVKNLGNLLLRETAAQLVGVEVVAKRPPFEQKIDRLVVNVAGSITSAGISALEVLERSPGIAVDRQGNRLIMSGKDGVAVMINGKINRMTKDGVLQMLAGIASANIEKIELIHTPPASFEAEGNAGFINIVLKQRVDQGFNGTYFVSAGLGRGKVAAASTRFNYRQNKVNFYGDYTFSRKGQAQVFTFDRQVVLDDQLIGTHTRTVRKPVQRNHNARLGLDLDLSPGTVLGVLVSGYDNRWSMDAVNDSRLTHNGLTDTLLTIFNDEVNHWEHLSGNLNLQHTFREGETLTFDADYLYYDNDNPTNYFTAYSDSNGNPLLDTETSSNKSTPIRVAVGKMDYTRRFSEKMKMEAGIKGTDSRFDNAVTVAEIQDGVPVNDPDLTAEYRLREYIGAAYFAVDLIPDSKTNLQLGLRYEFTSSNLGSAQQADIVDREYGNFFPTVFVSRALNEKHALNFSYSRRITRPTFNDMAPFVIFLDPYTFFSGNSALQPALSNSLKLDYRCHTVQFSVQYTHEKDAIAAFQSRVLEGTNRQLIAAENLKNRNTIGVSAALPVQIADWWQVQNNLTGAWQEANTLFDGDPVRVSGYNLQIVWINNFRLPGDFRAELVGTYQTKGLYGSAESLPMGGLNIGIQKQFGDHGGTLRFGIDDLLNSMEFRVRSDLPQHNLVYQGRFDLSQRTFKISYTCNFGNNKLEGARKRTTGAEEERRRVN